MTPRRSRARFIGSGSGFVYKIDEKIKSKASPPDSKVGTGGMITKVLSAEYANSHGIDLMICNSNYMDNLLEVIKKHNTGTFFHAKKNG